MDQLQLPFKPSPSAEQYRTSCSCHPTQPVSRAAMDQLQLPSNPVRQPSRTGPAAAAIQPSPSAEQYRTSCSCHPTQPVSRAALDQLQLPSNPAGPSAEQHWTSCSCHLTQPVSRAAPDQLQSALYIKLYCSSPRCSNIAKFIKSPNIVFFR